MDCDPSEGSIGRPALSGELTKRAAKRLRLQQQPFQLLAMLMEKPEELVTREELSSRLWPQTIAEFDHGLNKAIGKIPEGWGDSSENSRCRGGPRRATGNRG